MTVATKKQEEKTAAPGRDAPLPMLRWNKVAPLDQVRRVWCVKMPPTATQDDLIREGFWREAAQHFGRHDIVYALPDDESWEAELRVEASRVGQGCEMTVVKKFSRKGVAQAMTMLTDEFHTQWVPGDGWCVIRVADGNAVIRGHSSEDAAKLEWLRTQPVRDTNR